MARAHPSTLTRHHARLRRALALTLCALTTGCATSPAPSSPVRAPEAAVQVRAHTPPHDPQARCAQAHGPSCLEVAQAARARGDTARAAEAMQRACRAGLPAGCTGLGEAYVRGEVADRGRDLGYAARLFERACRGGDARGCALGFGLDELACAAKVQSSCVRAGAALLLGRGVAKDRARGEAMMRGACAAGEPHGCYNLAVLLRRHDPAQAAALRQRACRGGLRDACAPASATASNRSACTACAAAR